jgi:hypothetical protein
MNLLMPRSNPHYVLDADNAVVPARDLLQWVTFFEDFQRRRVAETVRDKVRVSTVFLGLDHRWMGDGPPLTFETMIFGGRHNHYQDRYSSWDDALLGHRRACLLAFPPVHATPSRNRREGRYLARLARKAAA